MRWVLHTYKVTFKQRIKHLLMAFQTFIFPVIWNVDYENHRAGYKPHWYCFGGIYLGGWLAEIQYDVECAVRGYWQGYGLE